MIRLHFEKLSAFERKQEPCAAAVPFARGSVREPFGVSVRAEEKTCPTQWQVTARWPDGSVKWLLVHFLADLPANRAEDYEMEVGQADQPANRAKDYEMEIGPKSMSCRGVTVVRKSERLSVDTGAISFTLCRRGEPGVFHHVVCLGNEYTGDQFDGPFITDTDGNRWCASVGETGWHIVESGPVRAVVETAGRHRNAADGRQWMDYTLRLYAYAGKPWVRMDYQVINREPGKTQTIHSMEIQYTGHGTAPTFALATSNYQSNIRQGGGGDRLYHRIDAQELLYEANEHIPEVFYGTFFGDWNDRKNGGVCVTVFQAYQNFPKALQADASGIRVFLLPEEGGRLTLPQGVAKTHRLYFHFHGAGETPQSLNLRSLQFQMPDRPTLDASVYAQAGVFEDVFEKAPVKKAEWFLISKADGRGRAYGALNWGDAPDEGYTAQGRGDGKLVWTNNEYDFPHAAMLLYARTGMRRMLDYMLVAAQHWLDVDICHYSDDPLRQGAQIIHSAGHVSGSVEMSHEWVEGLLDYYHQTGEHSAFEAAVGIGENVLRLLTLPKFHQKGGINARETGWGLRVLVALHRETGEERWLTAADGIIRHFDAWMDAYGGWLAPYTDHTVIRVPFMIAVAVGSLMRYYRVKPLEHVREMIVKSVRDLVANCRLENGLFYYKELPSLQRLDGNTLVLEALADAYELTGDAEFLKAGLDTFRCTVESFRLQAGGKKRIVEDALLLEGPGPKGFAQCFYPVAAYVTQACRAGIRLQADRTGSDSD